MNEVQQKNYWLVKFKILQKEYYTFWYEDDIDGFLLDQNGLLKSYPTKEEAVYFAKAEGFCLNTKAVLCISSGILRNIKKRKIRCNLFLNHWNTLSDVAHSIHCQFIGDDRENETVQHIYEKLFYGCNVLVKKGEEHYRPVWSKKERRWIAKVMKDGFRILAKGLNLNCNFTRGESRFS